MQWLSTADAAERLDWSTAALQRLLDATDGAVLPGAAHEPDGTWSVPESALRALIRTAPLFLFSISTLAQLLDADAGHLRRLARAGKLETVDVPHVGRRVPWREYQRLTCTRIT